MSGGNPPERSNGVMIDRPGTVDRDDAVWVRREGAGWRAWVHVADVARVVPLGSTEDVEALRRGQSTYLPDRTIAMLPHAAQAMAALRTGGPAAEPLPTCVIALAVDPAGALTEISIGRGALAGPVAASYEEAAGALADRGHPLHGMLTDAHDLARTLLARRQAAGALVVYDLVRGWATGEEGTIVGLAAPERNAGYLIVQELMIAANEAAARFAADRDLPLLFRNHRAGTASRAELADQLAVAAGPQSSGSGSQASPDPESRLETVTQHLAMVVRPAVYEPRVGGHFGLNLPAYTHATSPLRRYPDLVNQRILLAAADGRPSPYRLDTLEEAAAAVNLRQEGRRARRTSTLRSAAHESTRGQLAEGEFHRLDDGTFGKLVKLAVTEDRFHPALATELDRRAAQGRLLPRDVELVLFGTRTQRWRPVRERMLRWLAGEPAHATTVLALHGQREQAGGLRWEEEPVGTTRAPQFAAAARLGDRVSPRRQAPSKRAARQQAALALVAALAELPDPSGDIEAREPAEAPVRERAIPDGHPPAMAINELAQAGRLAELRWTFATDGAAHEPTHTCTVTARCPATGEQYTATGTATTKATAKNAAAAALWERVAHKQRSG